MGEPLSGSAAASLLGQSTAYTQHYAPKLLYPIARNTNRRGIGIADGAPLPFMGADLWTAFELSWLNPKGKPQVAIAHITVPCESPHIVESKSFKLYLNSFNQSMFESAAAVRSAIQRDVSHVLWQGSPEQAGDLPPLAGVRLLEHDAFGDESVGQLEGLLLDRLDVECTTYEPAPQLLTVHADEPNVSEVLVSHLLKSNCLVTNQPDWGSVQVSYTGAPIDQAGLLQYIVSFRQHNEFHEQCVERMFTDIWARCQPSRLAVYARYTRRGGLDINPFRTSHPVASPANVRLARQ